MSSAKDIPAKDAADDDKNTDKFEHQGMTESV